MIDQDINPFTLKTLRTFLSYESEHDNLLAGALKRDLENFGINAFIAHSDIKGSQEWMKEIINALDQCDIFIPLITDSYNQSFWTQQESGYAYAKGKKIIPIKNGQNPNGFIQIYQAIPLKYEEINFEEGKIYYDCSKTIEIIIQLMLDDESFHLNMRHCLINGFLNSKNYSDSAKKARYLLSLLKEFSDDEVIKIITGCQDNQQIYNSWNARPFIRQVIKEYNNVILPETIEEIEGLFLLSSN